MDSLRKKRRRIVRAHVPPGRWSRDASREERILVMLGTFGAVSARRLYQSSLPQKANDSDLRDDYRTIDQVLDDMVAAGKIVRAQHLASNKGRKPQLFALPTALPAPKSSDTD